MYFPPDSWNCGDISSFVQDPGKRNLRGGMLFSLREILKPADELEVSHQIVFLKFAAASCENRRVAVLGRRESLRKFLFLEGKMQRSLCQDYGIAPSSRVLGRELPEEHIGVRLEDMLLITPDGYENLSNSAPIEASDVRGSWQLRCRRSSSESGLMLAEQPGRRKPPMRGAVAGSGGFDVVADIPEGAVVGGGPSRWWCSPPIGGCWFERPGPQPTQSRLQRSSDADAAFAIDGEARHPSIEAAGFIGALLIELGLALPVDLQLIPSHASASGPGVDGVKAGDPLVTANLSIHQPHHQLLSLGVESHLGSGL